MRVQPLVLVAATVAYLAGAPSSALAQGSAPKGKWPVASPASVGLNKAVLDSLDAEIAAGKYGFIDRMLVIRHGKVAFDKAYVNDYMKAYGDSAKVKNALNAHDVTGPFNYFNTWWHPYYQRGDLHTLQSVTKTVASAVIGAAVTRGENGVLWQAATETTPRLTPAFKVEARNTTGAGDVFHGAYALAIAEGQPPAQAMRFAAAAGALRAEEGQTPNRAMVEAMLSR